MFPLQLFRFLQGAGCYQTCIQHWLTITDPTQNLDNKWKAVIRAQKSFRSCMYAGTLRLRNLSLQLAPGCATCLTSACRCLSWTHCSRCLRCCSAAKSSSCCFSWRNSSKSWTLVAMSTSRSHSSSTPGGRTHGDVSWMNGTDLYQCEQKFCPTSAFLPHLVSLLRKILEGNR